MTPSQIRAAFESLPQYGPEPEQPDYTSSGGNSFQAQAFNAWHRELKGFTAAMEMWAGQEPVAWDSTDGSGIIHDETKRNGVNLVTKSYTVPLYALPPITEQEGWQPIETAPKDGTGILVYTRNDNIYVVAYDNYFSAPWRIRNDQGLNVSVPTHWMPLPAAPRKETP